MQHAQSGRHVHQSMKPQPVLLESPDPSFGRGDSQGYQQQPGREARQNRRALDHVLDDELEVERLIYDGIPREVHRQIKESEQSDRPPERSEAIPAREAPNGRDGQGDQEVDQGGVAQVVQNLLDVVGPEAIRKPALYEPRRGRESQKPNQPLE